MPLDVEVRPTLTVEVEVCAACIAGIAASEIFFDNPYETPHFQGMLNVAECNPVNRDMSNNFCGLAPYLGLCWHALSRRINNFSFGGVDWYFFFLRTVTFGRFWWNQFVGMVLPAVRNLNQIIFIMTATSPASVNMVL